MIEIGKYNELTIERKVSVGLFLSDESGEEVLLPNKYCPEEFEEQDKIWVFVYPDNEGRKVATNLTPKLLLNEFAFLEVVAVEKVGAFLDWGLDKDLLVPFREQRQEMEKGRWYIIHLKLDQKTSRLIGTNKIEQHLQNDTLQVSEWDKVDLLVMQKTDLGYSVIINNIHKGLLFESDVYSEINVGQKLFGYVKKIREDNKIDVSLQPLGFWNANQNNTELIKNKLIENNGVLNLTDKSDPKDIHNTLGISKKAFKKAIGTLYKTKQIKIEETRICLIEM